MSIICGKCTRSTLHLSIYTLCLSIRTKPSLRFCWHGDGEVNEHCGAVPNVSPVNFLYTNKIILALWDNARCFVVETLLVSLVTPAAAPKWILLSVAWQARIVITSFSFICGDSCFEIHEAHRIVSLRIPYRHVAINEREQLSAISYRESSSM